MKVEDIRHILILGSGTIGREIGLQCAIHGYRVILYDVNSRVLEKAVGIIQKHITQISTKNQLFQQEIDTIIKRITTIPNPKKAAEHVDLIIESVPEDPKLKCKVFAQFNQLCPPHTIFTTTSSFLIPSLLAKATGRPTKFAALHFHPHVWESNVVDIMPHPGTSPETIEVLQEFAKRIGQIPIIITKEHSGYVFNYILSAMLKAALELKINNVSTIEDIDRSFMGIMKTPIGPFGIMDRIGLDTMYDIVNFWAKKGDPYRQLQKTAKFLKNFIIKGHYGVKNGKGFYTYPNPRFKRSGFIEGKIKSKQ